MKGSIQLVELTEREKDIVEALGNKETSVFEVTASANLGNCIEYWVDHYVRGQFKERLTAGALVVRDRQSSMGGNTRIILSYHDNASEGSKLWKMVVKLQQRNLCDDIPELNMKNVQTWTQSFPSKQPLAKGEPFTLMTLDLVKAIPAPMEVVREELKGGAHMVRLLEPHTYIFCAKFVDKQELKK
jgi:hypothetical protein